MKSELEKLRDKQQRRRRKRMIRILAVSPLVALIFVAALNLLFRINTLVVRNETAYSASRISADFGFSIGDGLLSFRKDKLSRSLTEAYPYVKSVEVEYKLPNTVEIRLLPASAVFAVEADGKFLLLDSDFKVLEIVDERPEQLLLVSGMDIEQYTLGQCLDENENIQAETLRELISVLQQRGLYEHTSSVDLTKKYNISMQIYDVITVRLGNSEDFPQKFDMLLRILDENDLSEPAEIRVRDYSQGRYFRLDPDSVSTDSDSSSAASSASDRKNSKNS